MQFGDSMFKAINLVLNNINQKQKEAITVSFWVAKHEIQTIVYRKPPWKDGPFKEFFDVSIIFSNKSLTIFCIFRVTYFLLKVQLAAETLIMFQSYKMSGFLSGF